VPAHSSLGDLLPHDDVLRPSELEELARALAVRPELWEQLVRVDRDRRRYELLYEDDRLDAWVLSWMPQQATGFHDHDVSAVGLAVTQGSVREDWMRYAGGHVEWLLEAGDSRAGGPGYVHRVQHAGGEPAVTIHVYSPRLDRVGQYRVDEAGILRREVQPGRRELTAQRIGDGALGNGLDRF
jgi:predicted metal-dependent enzyme (double-stranded beta helix superfamily)